VREPAAASVVPGEGSKVPLLTGRAVHKRYGAVHAVRGVDFSLSTDRYVTLLGPSGCGKTTILRMIGGFETVTAGVIELDGRPLLDTPPSRRPVNTVFQSYALFPHLNVADNVAFGLRRVGVDAGETRRRVDYALGFMGLRDFAGAYPAQLSGGMRQRVCIARTLVMQPHLILLDEPFGALDQQTRLLMGDELLRLWRDTGATIVLITHALDEAAMLSDRVGVMSARPGRFIDMVETGWGRERDSRIVAAPEFGTVTARLWSSLRPESMKALGR